MSNNDKFIRDTEFGKLMENKSKSSTCLKCKHFIDHDSSCLDLTLYMCTEKRRYYFAKDETDENKNLQNLQK